MRQSSGKLFKSQAHGPMRGLALFLQIVFVVSLSLSFLLTVPSQSNAAAGEWIEICGEAGAEMVRIDPATGQPIENCPDCATCGDCLLGRGDLPSAVTPGNDPVVFRAAARSVPQYQEFEVAPLPAMFWPDNRGPPAAEAYEISRAGSHVLATTQVMGRAPEC